MRHVLAGFATGIAVVAAKIDGRVIGLSANSFTSVSLDPPLVSVSFSDTSTSWPQLRRTTRWGISVLGDTHTGLLRDLRRPSAERFAGIEMDVVGDAAFVRGALARLTVELAAEIPAGDHVLTLLRVLALHRDDAQRPLVFFGSGAHRLADPAPRRKETR
jgi:flavin reductase (DIM6/NTAB) family NADH-FMN oxidoreductase RutF